MPLDENALVLVRGSLQSLQAGERVKPIIIGRLTDSQLAAVNKQRSDHAGELPPMISEVIFLGRHIYNSRIVRDDYLIEDVLTQIESAMSEISVVIPSPTMTAMLNPAFRIDRWGNKIQDQAIFECTARHPRPELFSIVPKGDKLRAGNRKGLR